MWMMESNNNKLEMEQKMVRFVQIRFGRQTNFVWFMFSMLLATSHRVSIYMSGLNHSSCSKQNSCSGIVYDILPAYSPVTEKQTEEIMIEVLEQRSKSSSSICCEYRKE